MTGADWIFELCELAERKDWSIYILAGVPGVVVAARDNLKCRFPKLRILYARDGFFNEADEETVIVELEKLKPDILFVGMGVPLQETWIENNLSRLSVRICWVVGALFDYVAGIEVRAPLWMRRLSLEWLWRLGVNPLGKWQRYLFGNPIFIYRLIQNKIILLKPS